MKPRPRYKSIALLLLAVLLLAACSPLRRVQRNQKADSTSVDRTEIQKAVHDILRESGTLSQTVVEFFPPTTQPVTAPTGAAPEETKDVWRPTPLAPTPQNGKSPTDGAGSVGIALSAAEPATPQPPAVRRIVHTEIAAERERETTTDSTANNDIHTATHTELTDKVAEKPPATTTTIKWIAIALSAVAAIILLLKFPKIKLPF